MILESITAISLSLASYHVTDEKFNQVNPGVAVEFTNHVVVGSYYNSRRKQTTFVAYDYQFNSYVSAMVGVGTGYHSPILGALRVKVGNARVRPVIFVMPKTIYNPWTFGFTVEMR